MEGVIELIECDELQPVTQIETWVSCLQPCMLEDVHVCAGHNLGTPIRNLQPRPGCMQAAGSSEGVYTGQVTLVIYSCQCESPELPARRQAGQSPVDRQYTSTHIYSEHSFFTLTLLPCRAMSLTASSSLSARIWQGEGKVACSVSTTCTRACTSCGMHYGCSKPCMLC